jgi:hypothetical protein
VARDELRRAYLRAVKAHSPERDPEGFQRVRAAYELLCARPWLRAALLSRIQDLGAALRRAP